MAVPNTNNFSLNEVRVELGLAANASLSQCVSASVNNSYDPDFEPNPPTNDLLGFRNYAKTPTYWQLSRCSGGAIGYTRLKPTLGIGQRYVNPKFPITFFTWNGSTISTSTAPTGFNQSIQRTTFTGCP